MLSRCTFNGQQCCSQYVIDQFDRAMSTNNEIEFNHIFPDAQKAVNDMRKNATGMQNV